MDPTAARLAFHEVLGLVFRRVDRFADIFAARDVWWNNSPLFRSKRPVNRALGICYGIRSGLREAGDHHTRDRYGPFPHLTCDPLNNRIFDAAIFHAGPSAFVLSPVNLDPLCAEGNLRGPSVNQRRRAIILRSGGVAL